MKQLFMKPVVSIGALAVIAARSGAAIAEDKSDPVTIPKSPKLKSMDEQHPATGVDREIARRRSSDSRSRQIIVDLIRSRRQVLSQSF